jgi:predicted translin family RNA/ssDNA-binding protein
MSWVTNIEEFKSQMSTFVQEYEVQDKRREETINNSRKVLKLAKQASYSAHREEYETAKELSKQAKELAQDLDEQLTGSVRAAFEELAESIIFTSLLTEKRIPLQDGLDFNISFETYLGALADVTGEIVRYAINSASKGQTNVCSEVKLLVEDIHGLFLQFDFRNGELRKKGDSVKYNLNKLENLTYEIARK